LQFTCINCPAAKKHGDDDAEHDALHPHLNLGHRAIEIGHRRRGLLGVGQLQLRKAS
jgi:hypothetical protein